MAEKKHTRSAARQGFMEQLNEWTAETVVGPVRDAFAEYDRSEGRVAEDGREKALDRKLAAVEKAIRQKVLESCRNGALGRRWQTSKDPGGLPTSAGRKLRPG